MLSVSLAIGLTLAASLGDGIHLDKIDFYSGRGVICPDGLNYAVYTMRKNSPRPGEEIEGCWKAVDGKVIAIFMDGDAVVVRVKDVQWVSGHKPPEV